MNKKIKIFIPAILGVVFVGGAIIFNRPAPHQPQANVPAEEYVLSEQDKADNAIQDEINVIFKEAEDHFVKGEFAASIASYKKVSQNPKYSMVDYGEFLASILADGSIEEVECVKVNELSKVKRSPEETIQGLLQTLHINGKERLDFISCRVCESGWLDSVCNFLTRDQVPSALLGQDLDRGLLAKINPGAKTFLKEESEERGTLYRITNETENLNDDVLLHVGSHPFAPERFRVEDVYRLEKGP